MCAQLISLRAANCERRNLRPFEITTPSLLGSGFLKPGLALAVHQIRMTTVRGNGGISQ